MEKKKGFLKGFLCGLLAAAVLAGGIFAVRGLLSGGGIAPAKQASEEGGQDEPLVDEFVSGKAELIREIISKYYLEDVPAQQLREGIYRGIVASLGDPYSVYYTEEELQAEQDASEGIYYGIGVYIKRDAADTYTYITGAMPGSPAEEAGLREGDIIRKVDGQSVEGWTQDEIVAQVKGEENTTVLLTVERDGQMVDALVVRRKMENQTVTSGMMEGKIGYVSILEFDTVTLGQFEAAMEGLEDDGMEALILDLRGNLGGNVNTVCDIARHLLPEGLIVYTEDKNGERTEHYCDGKDAFDKPLALLVDGASASASEILAGAVKDYGIGTLIGTTTFGKGIVQRPITMSDGSAVRLTVSKYYTPSGQNIHGVGIEPDIEVPWDYEQYAKDGTDNQLAYAVEYLTKALAGDTPAR